jgi:hypothetical protein
MGFETFLAFGGWPWKMFGNHKKISGGVLEKEWLSDERYTEARIRTTIGSRSNGTNFM